MSAQANLAGLFPPTGDQVWNPDIRWQPIPVHPLMGGDDKVRKQVVFFIFKKKLQSKLRIL